MSGLQQNRLLVCWRNGPQAMANLRDVIAPWAAKRFSAGVTLAVELRDAEADKTKEQRGYYHGVVLAEITAQVRPGGQRYSLQVWKEYFRDMFLGDRQVTFTNPITGEKLVKSVRVSTEELGVKGYARLIDQVIAWGAAEYGVKFPCTQQQWAAAQQDGVA